MPRADRGLINARLRARISPNPFPFARLVALPVAIIAVSDVARQSPVPTRIIVLSSADVAESLASSRREEYPARIPRSPVRVLFFGAQSTKEQEYPRVGARMRRCVEVGNRITRGGRGGGGTRIGATSPSEGCRQVDRIMLHGEREPCKRRTVADPKPEVTRHPPNSIVDSSFNVARIYADTRITEFRGIEIIREYNEGRAHNQGVQRNVSEG